jgi:hypothetical protein
LDGYVDWRVSMGVFVPNLTISWVNYELVAVVARPRTPSFRRGSLNYVVARLMMHNVRGIDRVCGGQTSNGTLW